MGVVFFGVGFNGVVGVLDIFDLVFEGLEVYCDDVDFVDILGYL